MPASCLLSPRQQPTSGVGFAAVVAGDRLVVLHPPVELGQTRVPRHGRVVGVTRGDHPVGCTHPAHLAQRSDRVGEMLEHLMRVHHVERRVGDVERVDVTHRELHIGGSVSGDGAPRRVDDVSGAVDADHGTGRNE